MLNLYVEKYLCINMFIVLQAPMADCWDNITVGMKVEVENMDCDKPGSFWVASVMQIAGSVQSLYLLCTYISS